MLRTEIIGSAILHLGDCRQLIPSVRGVDAIVTDPPYGLSFDYGAGHQPKNTKQRDGNRWGKEWGKMTGDHTPFEPNILLRWPAVIWGANHFCTALPSPRTWLVWDKGVPEGMSSSACELAWTSLKGGGVRRMKLLWSGFRREVEVRQHFHPTQKPVKLMEWCIAQISKRDHTIFDPFMGAGATGVAAVRAHRKFVGVEIEPEFFDTACRRIEAEVAQCRLAV